MAREGRAVWEARVRRLGESDLTTKEFAAELGVNERTLTYWKWRFGKEARESERRERTPKASKPTFVEVRPSEPVRKDRSRIEVVLDGGVVVRVPDDFESETLQRVVAALKATAP